MYRTISAFEVESILARFKVRGQKRVSREEIKKAYIKKFKTSDDSEAEKVIAKGLAQLLEDGVIREIGNDTFEYLL